MVRRPPEQHRLFLDFIKKQLAFGSPPHGDRLNEEETLLVIALPFFLSTVLFEYFHEGSA